MSWMRSTPLVCLLLTSSLSVDLFAAGVLLPRDGSAPIAVQSHRVTAVLDDGLARTTLRQTFVNNRGRELEAIYLFPVPDGAALVGLALEVAGERHEGVLAERQAARRTYDTIVRRKKDPALVEQIGRSKFRMSVYPVLPDQPTVVEVTWIELVPLAHGEYRYVYPLALDGEAAQTEQDLTVSVTVRSSAPIVEVTSPTDGMVATRISEHQASASLEKTGAKLDQDVVVVARVATPEPSLVVRVFRPAAGDPIFAAVLTPPELRPDQVLARDVILALDVSGSMDGTKIEQAKSAALWLLDHLRPRDRVNILLFNDDIRRFAEDPVAATTENLKELRSCVNQVQAGGGTAFGDAVRVACSTRPSNDRLSLLVMLSDGRPTVGETRIEQILSHANDGAAQGLRIYAFGVGGDVDSALLRGVASAGRGKAELFRPKGEIESRLRSFLTRIESPAIANLKVTVGGREVLDLLPRPLPDIFLGEQAVITGRLRTSGDQKVEIRGLLDGKVISLASPADFGDETATEARGHRVVRDLYAWSKLRYLQQAQRLRVGLSDEAYFKAVDRGTYSTRDELVKAQIALSLESGIQCPYTAFLSLLPEDRQLLEVAAAQDDVTDESDEYIWEAGDVEEEIVYDTLSGVNDVVGVGGGAGGSSVGKYRRRASMRIGGRASHTTYGVDWLSRHQDARGFWSSSEFTKMCSTNRCDGAGSAMSDVGVTSLALLPYLGAGNTVSRGKYKALVRRGLRYLISVQDPDTGCFGDLESHALATLAMVEAYGLSKWPILKKPAQQGVDFLLSAMNPGGGDSLLLTAWAVMALKSAEDFGLTVDPVAFARAWKFVEAEAARRKDDICSTAVAMLCLIFLGEDPENSPTLRNGADLLLQNPPLWDEEQGTIDFRYWFFGSYAMWQMAGDDWERWQSHLLNAVIKTQRQEGDEKGSWDPQFDPHCLSGGRVYSTALMTLTMEVYCRYDRIYIAR